MVTGGNRLAVSRRTLEAVLADACSSEEFDPRRFALTRFDHGAYVFEPPLAKLQRGRRAISAHSLKRLLMLLGLLCEDSDSPCVIRFRDYFSVKSGLGKKNQSNFNELFEGVKEGDRHRIERILARHNCGTEPMESQIDSD